MHSDARYSDARYSVLNVPSYESPVSIVHFIHQSVKEFFVDEGLAFMESNPPKGSNLVALEAHYHLCSSCRVYWEAMYIPPVEADIIGRNRWFARHPFAYYTVHNWALHAQCAEALYVGPSSRNMLKLLSWPSDDIILRKLQPLSSISRGLWLPGTTAMHMAARHGMERSMVALIKSSRETDSIIDSADRFGRTPFVLAIREGHVGSIKLLLETSLIDTNSRDQEGFTPLHYPTCESNEIVMKQATKQGYMYLVSPAAADGVGNTQAPPAMPAL